MTVMGGGGLPQIRLSFNGLETTPSVKKRVAEVQAKVERQRELAQDDEKAWQEIFRRKNSASDLEKLKKVYDAMKAGKLAREQDKVEKRKPLTKAEALRLYTKLVEMERAQMIADLIASTPKHYRLVTDEGALYTVCRDAAQETMIAVDTETTGVDLFGDDRVVGVSMTLPRAGYSVYIPFGHRTGETQLPENLVFAYLRDVLENEAIKKVLHNAKFDIHAFAKCGIVLRGLYWDTMIAMHMLNENEPSFALKNLATKYLKTPSDTYETLFGKSAFSDVPLDAALVYAAKDADITFKLYEFQRQHLSKYPNMMRYFLETEMPIIEISAEMERVGFIIDKERADELKRKLTQEQNELLHVIQEIAARYGMPDINVNSPAQLTELLYNRMKLRKYLPPNVKLSTDVDTLKKLAPHSEICSHILAYRERAKLLGTYIDALPRQVKADGRLHGQFNQIGTVTGRFSSNNPNLQNQPKYARVIFVAPENAVIIGMDFSQQEPRLLAHFSGEPELIEAYRQGKDLYSSMAAKVFGVPIEECGDGSKYRKMMKFGVLSVMYGTGPKTLAGQLGITEAEAELFINDFYKTFPKVASWIEGNKRFARENGFVWMMDEQRKRRLPVLKNRFAEKWEQFRAERQATNAIIQGSAAIQTKKTMVALHRWCKRKQAEGRLFQLVATVHDEVLLYAPLDVTREEVDQLRDIMVNTVKLAVPNKTDIEIMTRWGEGYSVDEWFSRFAQ